MPTVISSRPIGTARERRPKTCSHAAPTGYEAGDRHPGVSGALTRLGNASCASNISRRSMVKTVTLVVITAVEGAPDGEIRTSAF
jgi:hypothetical protein